MKTQISRLGFRPAQRYSGLQMQQGRMLTDADWNELGDILDHRLVRALAEIVKSGAPKTGGLSLNGGGAPTISPGRLYVEGLAAELLAAGPVALNAQPDYPNPPPVPAGDLRFYADVWERAVTALEDAELMDPGLHGADTATRTQTMLQIKWCVHDVDPADANANPALGDAPLTLNLRSTAAAIDPCDRCAAEVKIDERIGNYLFRVEVHDVFDAADGVHLVLKWSRDNGAEAYASADAPDDFTQGAWVWEFFDPECDKLLGAHPTAPNRVVRRGLLSDQFDIPSAAGAPKRLVRQWDGFCEINLTTRALVANRGFDRGVTLRTDVDPEAPGFLSFADGALSINLERLDLRLGLDGRKFLPGDFWLGVVREAVNDGATPVLDQALPIGVRHHYLELGRRLGGVFLPPLGLSADALRRRLHFPPLTELEAADVAYSPPDDCLGIYGPDAAGDSVENVKQALDRICDIDAQDIGFTLKNPLPPNTVASLMSDKLGALWPNLDGQPKNPSVADMLWALLYEADAGSLPYNVPACVDVDGPITVGALLGLTSDPNNTGEILNRLLCNLNADALPLGEVGCPDLQNSGAQTVQAALDFLCRRPSSSCAEPIRSFYRDAEGNPINELEQRLLEFAEDEKAMDIWLCLLPGEHIIGKPVDIRGKRGVRIGAATAAGATVRLVDVEATLSIQTQEVAFDGFAMIFADGNALRVQANRIVGARMLFYKLSHLRERQDVFLPAVVLGPLEGEGELNWNDNLMGAIWSRPHAELGRLFPDNVADGPLQNVLDALRILLERSEILLDARLRREQLAKLNELIFEGTPREEIANWEDYLTENFLVGGVPDRVTGGLLRDASLNQKNPYLAAAPVGAQDIGTLADFLVNAIQSRELPLETLLLLREFGYATALALTEPALSGRLRGNHVEGEIVLANGLWKDGVVNRLNWIDPADILGFRRLGEEFVRAARGHLHLSDNRIERFWSAIPTQSINEGIFRGPISGYESLAFTGNTLNGRGHSLVAETLTVQGNHFHNTALPEEGDQLAVFFSRAVVLTGNIAFPHRPPNSQTVIDIRVRLVTDTHLENSNLGISVRSF